MTVNLRTKRKKPHFKWEFTVKTAPGTISGLPVAGWSAKVNSRAKTRCITSAVMNASGVPSVILDTGRRQGRAVDDLAGALGAEVCALPRAGDLVNGLSDALGFGQG